MARRPYAWSLFPDGTNVVRVVEQRTDRTDAGRIDGAVRRGVDERQAPPASPSSPRRTRSTRSRCSYYQGLLAAAGIDVTLNMKYKLDISSMPNQASNIIAQLKDAGITTVLCGCDPVMLALGLTPKANEQSYEPEWVTAGLAFVDQDIVSQLIDDEAVVARVRHRLQRRVRAAGPLVPVRRLQAGAAERRARLRRRGDLLPDVPAGHRHPDGGAQPHTRRPSRPGCSPTPAATDPAGCGASGAGDYTPTDDYREIWWDPNRISPQNNKAGAWVQLNGGRRWDRNNPPTGPAGFFQEG